MLRNRNWMCPEFYALFDADAGGGSAAGGEAAGDSGAGDGAGNGAADAGNDAGNGGEAGTGGEAKSAEALAAEIARLNGEIARQKAALDKATHEASTAKKDLKARMTQEEIDAQAKKEAQEKAAQELEDLRREVAKGKTVKTVMGKLGLDEEAAGNLADHLFGASDIENALLEIQKAWQAKEAALRKEFGKITGPGAGADSNSPEAQAIARAAAFGKAKNAQNEQAQKAMNYWMK